MFKKSLLLTLLMALLMPWAAQAQTRERLTFDFEDNAIPSTWTNDATYPWVVVSESTDSGHTGTYCIKSGNTGVNSSSSTLSATFTFWDDGTISFLGGCYGEGTSYVWDKCIFSIDGDQQFANGALQTWETYTYEVTAGEHTFTWAFTKDSSVSATGDAFFVDNIVVDLGEAPACPPPTGVAVSNIGSYGATISWTGTNDSYIVLVGQPTIASSYDFEDNEIPADFTNDATYPWTVAGNTHSGAYCAKSATGNNSQTSALELEVTLASAKNLTFSAKVSSEASYDKAYFSIDGTVKINGISGAGDWIDYSYTLAAGTHTLRWYYTKDSSVASNDDCFYVDDIVLSSVDSWDETHTASASPYTFTDLNPETEYYVCVKGVCGSDQSDPSTAVSFTTMPTCIVPLAFGFSDVTAHEATLSWTSEASAWQICLNGDESNPILANSNPFTLTGLDPETAYTVKVRAICSDDDFSNWTNEISFTTPVACPVPTNLAVSDITPFTANVSWASESTVELRYVDNPNYCFQGFVTDRGAMADGSDASWIKDSQGTWGPSMNYAGGYYMADDFTVNAATTLNEIEVYGYQTGSTTESTFTGLYAMILNGNPMEGEVDTIWGDMTTNLMTSTSFTNCYRGSDDTPNEMTRPIMAITAAVSVNLEPGTYWLVYGTTGTMSSGPWCVPYAEPVIGNTGESLQHTSNGWNIVTDSSTGESFGCAMKLDLGDIESFNWTYANNISTGEYAMTNLDPETPYMVQVRANCGEEGYSNWVTTMFTTLPTCLAPTNLVIRNITARTAVLSWTPVGNETAWQLCFNDEEERLLDVTENPYTITGLDPDATYTVKIRAYCSNTDQSEWSSNISFTTDVACPAPTDLNVTELTPTSATLSWTGSANEYLVQYRPYQAGGDMTFDFEDSSMGDWTTIDADGDGYDWTLGSVLMSTGNGHNGSNDLVLSQSYDNNYGALTPDNYLVSPMVKLGGSITFWACAQDASWANEHFGVAVSTTGNTNAANFTTIAEFDMTSKGKGRIATVAENVKPQVRGGNRDQGTWYEYTVDLSEYSGFGYVAIRHFNSTDWFYLDVDDITISSPSEGEEIEWISTTVTTNSITISDLTEGTTYQWKVQAVCGGEDGSSTWATGNIFTTPSACDAPTALNATNVLPQSAMLNWNGLQDSYYVRYRTAASSGDNAIFFEDFEEGLTDGALPTGWISIDNDGDGYGWESWSEFEAHSDSTCIASASYINNLGALTPDNWLVSPQLDLQGMLKVWLRGQDPSYVAEHFAIYLSTTGNTVDDFTIELLGETVATGNYVAYTADLTQYAGRQGYIAIRHFNCTDMYWLNVDDFGIYDYVPAGDWSDPVVVENTTSYPLAGLEPETAYEWQVQGISQNCGDEGVTEWSEIANFTTLAESALVFVTDGYWNNASSWYNNNVAEDFDNVIIQANAIIPAGEVISVNNVILDGGSITIEDGGQLIHNTDGLVVTMENEIEPYTDANSTANYHLIAFPFMDNIEVPEAMTADEGNDFYMFFNDAVGEEWQNNVVGEEHGRIGYVGAFDGYLYANPTGITLSLTGPTTSTPDYGYGYSYDVEYDNGNEVNGWSLLGNPYTSNAYIYGITSEGIIAMEVMYYDENGNMQSISAGPVAPLQGFFVKVTEDTAVYFLAEEYDLSSKTPLKAVKRDTKKIVLKK